MGCLNNDIHVRVRISVDIGTAWQQLSGIYICTVRGLAYVRQDTRCTTSYDVSPYILYVISLDHKLLQVWQDADARGYPVRVTWFNGRCSKENSTRETAGERKRKRENSRYVQD